MKLINITICKDAAVRKAVVKRSSDMLEKLGIAGMALGVFQSNVKGVIGGAVFLSLSYLFTILGAKE